MMTAIKQNLKILLRVLILGAFFAAGLMLNIYLGLYFTCRDCHPALAQANHIAHWITLAGLMVFTLAFAFAPKNWILLVWLAPGMVAFFWWYGYNLLPRFEPDVQGDEISVMTYNVLGYLTDPERTFAVIQAMDADIVALQELRPNLADKLAAVYPYHITSIPQHTLGRGIFSRFPIIENSVEPEFDPSVPGGIRAVIDVHGQHIAIYVFHAPEPGFTLWQGYDDFQNRNSVMMLVDMLKEEILPVLVMCDCNTSPRTRQYAWLDSVLDDAFANSGWGFGLTHNGLITIPFPTVRIDYIWYSDAFTPLDTNVWDDAGGSDHHPVLARLMLRSDLP